MSLKKYNKKRQFGKTPEPKGKKLTGRGPLTFVVQKHEATRLHYDFRLELNGSLKSWAIPKGPSLNPENKHLAVMVEDHPVEYASFEGIIPKGNYGGGTVMIWDEGVYSPLTVDLDSDGFKRDEAEKILKGQLEKGHLTFVLLGKKLKGEFALVKTREKDNTWLLIKKGDEFASKKEILEKDRSVVTGRSMNEIARQAEKKKEVWISKPKNILVSAPKTSMPEVVKPMLAEATDEPFDKANWLFEMKWDGYRAIAEINSAKVRLYSRNNQPFNEKFAPVVKSLEKFPTSAVLDGEVVILDPKGHAQFQWLQDYPKSQKGELVYYIFDILYYDGKNTKNLPLKERKDLLKKILPPLPHIAYSDHIETAGKTFFREAKKLGVEGVMAKNSESIYKEGVRTREWLKIKTVLRQEAVIAGFTSPKGGRKYFGALILGVYKKGQLTYIGHTGGGFNDEDLKSIVNKLKSIRQDHSPFKEPIETNAPVTWVKPRLICEISFSEWTKDKQMRHPIFVGLREDKNPAEVQREKNSNVIASDDTKLNSGKQKIKVSNPNKIFFPKEGYTKGDLIEYYKQISKIILPHLLDRPQSLLRYPNGITGESFFQKNMGGLIPSWIKTKRVKTENHDITYMLCQDEASLLYMINLGCIDINPWSSKVASLDKPDYLVIDLDPEKANFEKVVKVALAVREVLENLDIEGYPKTSGAKGIHVYIPMNAKYNYEQVKQFAELLCLHVQNKIPDLTSILRSPEKRQGKVYLDYLQNRKGQTLASVYSVRARPEAPVSTPLMWKEVTQKLTPDKFTIKNILRRIQKQGDLFKPVLGKGTSIEKVLEK